MDTGIPCDRGADFFSLNFGLRNTLITLFDVCGNGKKGLKCNM